MSSVAYISNSKTVDHPILRLALERGLEKLVALQNSDGSWRGDYGGPMFLLPMYVAANYITGRPIPLQRREGMINYIRNVQNSDGSIGLHVEADGSMFTTVLCYVALRLLDVPREDPHASRMLQWIRRNGSALACASWGKFTLALLNLYDYDGLNPVLPELWLLPSVMPMHPGRFWCHCRQVYLPMAYLYGRKAKVPVNDRIRQLRGDLYDQPYEQIRFADYRNTVASMDNYAPTNSLLQMINHAMGWYESWHPQPLRQRALSTIFEHIEYEDQVTHFIRIGPVNAVFNTLVHHFHQPDSEAVRQSFITLDSYLFEGHDGVKMNGYNSTALWDTAFAVQAILATPLIQDYLPALRRAYGYLRDNQVIEDVPRREQYYRHASRGGWPFSDRAHGWPITDCTSEGLKCALALEKMAEPPIPDHLLQDSVRLILSFQNRDGGWATYEKQRGGKWLEHLNPSNVFADIMVDYSYVECTSACIQALTCARQRFPLQFEKDIRLAIRRGEQFIRNQQRPDGSWEGSWAVCFTYGTWFAVWGLMAAGTSAADLAIQRACRFLLKHQKKDGGWGEHHTTCTRREYVEHPESQVVNTAWALLTLIRAGEAESEAVRRGIEYLISQQLEDGDWPRQSLVGVFNKTALINYENYRRYFPVWALANYARATGLI